MDQDFALKLLSFLIPLSVSIAAAWGTYRVFQYRIEQLEKRMDANAANDSARTAEIQKMQLDANDKFATVAMLKEIKDEIHSLRAEIISIVAGRNSRARLK
jgi:hypothetical protein